MSPNRSGIASGFWGLLLVVFTPPLQAETPVEVRPLVSFSGANTQIVRHEQQRIVDQPSWEQFWLRHTGQGGTPEQYDRYRPTGAPAIDFKQCLVVAITESPGELNAGIVAVSIMEHPDRIVFDYDHLPYQAREGTSAPGNAFGFFVLPRTAKPIVLRHNVQDSRSRFSSGPRVWEEVITLRAIESVAGTTPGQFAESKSTSMRSEVVPDSIDPQAAVVDSQRKLMAWNFVFGHDPGAGKYDGVVGKPAEYWNLVSAGENRLTGIASSDGIVTDVSLELSPTDGNWGIEQHSGIFHGYLYHNCQCVDLQATIQYLSRGEYDIYVYAHGDAPEQNANIVLSIGDEKLGEKSTLNDGSWRFHSKTWEAGNQYVKFHVAHGGELPLVITSRRDGSNYAMLNAIQIVKVDS